jgi:hypothetical protein
VPTDSGNCLPKQRIVQGLWSDLCRCHVA